MNFNLASVSFGTLSMRIEHCLVFLVNTCLYLDSRWNFTLTITASVRWEIPQNLTIFCVRFPVKGTCEEILLSKLQAVPYRLHFKKWTSFASFFLIFDNKFRPITFRWLVLFITFTQVVFTEKVCFIETTSFNYSFTETWSIQRNPFCRFLLGTHH